MLAALTLLALLQASQTPQTVASPTAAPGILIERRVAEDLVAGVGDTVWAEPATGEIAPRPFVVEGIFERPADPNRIARNDYEVRFHLPDLEAMLPVSDRVDRFAVQLRDGADREAATRWIERLAFGVQVYDAETLANESSTTFLVVSRFHDAIALVTLLASGIFLLCLMVIRVDERRADVRTLRLVGVSRRSIVKTILLEAVMVAGIASVAGAALGWLLTLIVNAYYAGYYDTTLRFAIPTGRIIGLSIILGALLGVAAGGLAALRVAGLPPQRLGER